MNDKDLEQRSVHDFVSDHETYWGSLSKEEQELIRAKNKADNEAWLEKNKDKTLNDIMSEELSMQFDCPGWVYGDLPKMTKEFFDKFVEIAGEGNIKWITQAVYENWRDTGQDYYRGQYLISPEGKMNMQRYVESLNNAL